LPPVVLIGGMTQTVASWGGQLRPLSAHREVVAYEARGQGETELDVTDCSPARHVDDFVALVQALGLRVPLDLCGFSFGGRQTLGIAATRPDLIDRIVLSSVSLDRTVMSRLIVDGWIACLRTGDLETLARVSLPETLGAAYLAKNAHLVDAMIKTTVQRNRFDGIRALFEQTLVLPEDSEWHPTRLATQVRCPALVLGGEADRIADPDQIRALANALGAHYEILHRAGHTIPIESPEAWRAAVERFLAEPRGNPLERAFPRDTL